VRDLPCGDLRIFLEVAVRRVACRTCGRVRQERLDWLAANPHYTKRFALYVGKQCRGASVKEVATDLHLDWHAVKEMDKLYMREQLARAGPIAPAIIGIDELSVRKGHVYRVVVSDLEQGQPLWFGGGDRSEESLAMFFDFLGPERSKGIRLAVMDMWKAFRNATEEHAPQAEILYDKYHVLRQLNTAIDKVRKAEYKRLTNRADRKYIKGQKYVLLSHRENLSPREAAATQDVPRREQAAQHRVRAKGAVRPAVGLPPRAVGPALLRAVAGGAAVAAAQALRGLRGAHRAALGGRRRVLPPGEQSGARFRGRTEQQDPCYSAAVLRPP
jgi:transposase